MCVSQRFVHSYGKYVFVFGMPHNRGGSSSSSGRRKRGRTPPEEEEEDSTGRRWHGVFVCGARFAWHLNRSARKGNERDVGNGTGGGWDGGEACVPAPKIYTTANKV